MSHFSALTVNIKTKASLIAALEALGFQPEVNETPVHLYGYRGDQRSQMAEIVVRRSQINASSNDLGFAWNNQTKSYDVIISEFDQGWGECKPKRGLGKKFMSELVTEYTAAEIKRQGKFAVVNRTKNAAGLTQLVVEAKQKVGKR